MSTISMSLLRGTGEGGGEISLEGSLIITKGTSEDYKITDYDSFSGYTVRSGQGFDVVVVGDTITVSIPVDFPNSQASFFVSRNGSEKAFTVAMDDQSLVTPRILSPVNGSIGQSTNLTFTASNYDTIPSGIGTLEEAHWQVSSNSSFSFLIRDEVLTSGRMAQYPVTGLPIGTELFVRVRYKSSESLLGWSEWSNTTSFITVNETILTPRIGLDQPPFDVNETPVFTSDVFSTYPSGSDSHLSSSWRILRVVEEGENIQVFSRSRSMTDLTRLEVPRGTLEPATEYIAQVRYEGSRIGESAWSDPLVFNTATSFVPEEVGTPWEGGFYAGRIMVNGSPHAIVLSSRVAGGQSAGGLAWKTSQTTTTNTGSLNDCKANMQGAIAAGINLHPAFKFCHDYRGGGYSDWLLPSLHVVNILYRNFKPDTTTNRSGTGSNPNAIPPLGNYTSGNPSRTLLTDFRGSTGESIFQSNYMWTSSQLSSILAYDFHANDGHYHGQAKTDGGSSRYARAVRIIPI